VTHVSEQNSNLLPDRRLRSHALVA
jgi:hypothetical protein